MQGWPKIGRMQKRGRHRHPGEPETRAQSTKLSVKSKSETQVKNPRQGGGGKSDKSFEGRTQFSTATTEFANNWTQDEANLKVPELTVGGFNWEGFATENSARVGKLTHETGRDVGKNKVQQQREGSKLNSGLGRHP